MVVSAELFQLFNEEDSAGMRPPPLVEAQPQLLEVVPAHHGAVARARCAGRRQRGRGLLRPHLPGLTRLERQDEGGAGEVEGGGEDGADRGQDLRGGPGQRRGHGCLAAVGHH